MYFALSLVVRNQLSKKATNSWLVLALECYSPLGEGPANEIRVVVNWFNELERLVPTK